MSTQLNYPISTTRWHGAVRFFHWTSALLLIVAWLMMALHENTEDANYTFINLHKAFGVAFAFWIVARIITRLKLRHLQPVSAHGISIRMQRVTSLVHSLLYVVMLAMPVAGFMMSQYAGYPVNMFGLFTIAVMVEPNKALGDFFHDAHTGFFWTSLLVLAGGHIAAALYHQLIKKDKTINRML